MEKIKERLKFLYPKEYEAVYEKLCKLIEGWKEKIDITYDWVDNKDVMLITYGDGLKNNGQPPLQVLGEFLNKELKGCVSAVHLLPMFPYTSDDGFSVSDFKKINPDLGDWEHIEDLKKDYDLMFDAVVNHASKSSMYFQEFLKESPRYKNFFIVADPSKDYSMVTRPRTLPLLTKFDTVGGEKWVWTTFSDDQIDFNYKEPEVLLEILDILLLYASKGARFIRFDAIGFAWKEDNSTCMHLPQVHEMVKLMRDVLDYCVKGCTIITETNVPHKDNISYFGNGYDEAGMVYQFPLPPLTLHSFISADASELTKWAASLEETTPDTTYFNFLASHDGIGVRPVEDILSPEQRQQMVDAVLSRGGQIGYRSMPDGSQVPYELNINYLDAVAGDLSDADEIAQKFISSQCVLTSLMGMPAIYYHSILGSRNCYKDYEESGIKRRLNREKLDFEQLNKELSDRNSLRSKVLTKYKAMLNIRKEHKAFSPNAPQKVLSLDKRVFSLIREKDNERILALINVSGEEFTLDTQYSGVDLFTGKNYKGSISVPPYGYFWILLDN